MISVEQFDWFSENCYWSVLEEEPSAMRGDYRGALRDINGDSQFTQPPLKFVEVRLADKESRLAGRGYDGRVVPVEGQLDVVRGWGMSLTYRLKRTREINPPELTKFACLDEMTWLSGRTLRTSDP